MIDRYNEKGCPLVSVVEEAIQPEQTYQLLAEHLQDKWELEDVVPVRRVGCLKAGEIISLIAASSPYSVDAFAACQHGISHLKKMATIDKTELGVC